MKPSQGGKQQTRDELVAAGETGAIAAGALASVRHLKESRVERDRRQERAARLKRCLAEAGLPIMPSASHIVPVMVGAAQDVQPVIKRGPKQRLYFSDEFDRLWIILPCVVMRLAVPDL